MNFVTFTTEDYPELLKGNIGCAVTEAWAPIVKGALDELEVYRLGGDDITVKQIKEKFGTLRIYAGGDGWNCSHERIIIAAEEKAAKTCSVCGFNGDVQLGYITKESGWLLTLCKEHRYQGD